MDIRDLCAAKIPFGHMLVNSSAKEKKKILIADPAAVSNIFLIATQSFSIGKKNAKRFIRVKLKKERLEQSVWLYLARRMIYYIKEGQSSKKGKLPNLIEKIWPPYNKNRGSRVSV